MFITEGGWTVNGGTIYFFSESKLSLQQLVELSVTFTKRKTKAVTRIYVVCEKVLSGKKEFKCKLCLYMYIKFKKTKRSSTFIV